MSGTNKSNDSPSETQIRKVPKLDQKSNYEGDNLRYSQNTSIKSFKAGRNDVTQTQKVSPKAENVTPSQQEIVAFDQVRKQIRIHSGQGVKKISELI